MAFLNLFSLLVQHGHGDIEVGLHHVYPKPESGLGDDAGGVEDLLLEGLHLLEARLPCAMAHLARSGGELISAHQLVKAPLLPEY